MGARAGIAAGLAVLALAAGPAAARQVVLVGNLADGTVTVVDADGFRVLGRIDVIPDGDTPQDPVQAAAYPALVGAKGVNYVQGLAVSPDGQTLYVSRGFLGDVAAFSIADGAMLWRAQTSSLRADHIALSPDGRRLFVSALTSNEVQVLDTRSHAFVGAFATGDWPHVLEFSPDERLLYNGSLGNQLLPAGADGRKQLTVVDPATLKVVRTYPFAAGVRPFAFSPEGATAYVQLSYLNGFAVVDLASGRVVRTVDLPVMGPAVGMKPSDYPNQAAHHGIALSGDGGLICDAGTVSNYVALVTRPALELAAIIPVGEQPAEAETSTDGRYCLVTNRGPGPHADTLSVISYAQRREVARIAVGNRPQEETEADVPDSVLQRAGLLGPSPALTGASVARRRTGRPVLRFTLSRAATVAITVQRLERGRALRRGRLVVAGRAGLNAVRVPARLGGRAVGPGRYRARLRARTADRLASEVAVLVFTVT